MDRSTDIQEISKAIAASQRAMLPAKKNKKNPHFRSSYADLSAVIQALEPIWENGLSFVQCPSTDPERGLVTVETVLMHESGQWISATTSCVPSSRGKSDFSPQAVGSAITYLKRYGLQSMLGMASVDDDGERAMGRSRRDDIDRSSSSRQNYQHRELPIIERHNEGQDEPVGLDENGHHPSFTDRERKGFCVAVKRATGRGYDDVKAWCLSLGRPKPSAMQPMRRAELLKYLQTDAGQEALESFVVQREFAASQVGAESA